MKTLFVIDGTSGIWKSDLINYIKEKGKKSCIVPKYSTRKKTNDDTQIDLNFIEKGVFDRLNFDFTYLYDGHQYGFFKRDIDNMFKEFENIFIVVRNLGYIEELDNVYSKSYNVIKVFIYTDFDAVSKRITSANQLKSKESIENTFQEYLRHPDVYDTIIINGGTEHNFYRLIDLTVERFTQPNKNTIIKTSDNLTKQFCKKLATKKANTFLFLILISGIIVYIMYIYMNMKYGWDFIEPKLSLLSIPIVSIIILYSFFLITKKELKYKPKEIYEAIIGYYENKYINECCEK